ncbi:MAG: sulfite exporter TauE/SafE family protein [Gallionella sp.]|jgi:hypothetical protein
MLAIVLGALIGLILALTGAGGGILAVPALTLGLGWSIVQASPVALLTVACAAAIGMLGGLRQGVVRFRAAILISVAGIIAASFGQRLAHILPERWLTGLFACVMLIVAVRLFRLSGRPSTRIVRPTCIVNTTTGRINWNVISFLKLCVIGLISGLSTGLLGVGGGFIIVPALIRCSNIAMNGIIATSLMVIALVSAGAVISASTTGNLNLSEPALLFICGAAGGMLLGRSFAAKVPAALLQNALSILLTGVALAMLYRTMH